MVRSGSFVSVLSYVFTCGPCQYDSASTRGAVPESISQNLAFEFDYSVSEARKTNSVSLTLEENTSVSAVKGTVLDEEAVAEAAAAAAALGFGTILGDDVGVAVVELAVAAVGSTAGEAVVGHPLRSISIAELPEPGAAVVELAVAALGSTAGEAVDDPPLRSISIAEFPVPVEAPVENSSSKSSPLAAWHDRLDKWS